jgi:hypothetical protein
MKTIYLFIFESYSCTKIAIYKYVMMINEDEMIYTCNYWHCYFAFLALKATEVLTFQPK